MPKRWVVERSFAWLEKCRWLWKNCEQKLNASLQFVTLAFLALLSKERKQALTSAIRHREVANAYNLSMKSISSSEKPIEQVGLIIFKIPLEGVTTKVRYLNHTGQLTIDK